MNTSLKYEIAFSFAGEDRNVVEPIAKSLRKYGVRVFYDKFEKVTLWGVNLFDHLHELYSKHTRYVVIFISKSYVERDWTRLERQASQSKSLKSKEPFILPIMLESVELPGLPETVGFLNYKEEGQDGIVKLILEKLGYINESTQPIPKMTINIAGRKNEIELFSNMLDNAKVKVDVMWIYGPSGIGKTELMSTFCHIARQKGFEYKRGIIGIEDISSVLNRIFESKVTVSQLSGEDIRSNIITKVRNELYSLGTNMVIAIDTVREFKDYSSLIEYMKYLLDMLKDLGTRTVFLIATLKKPVSKIGIHIELQGLTSEEIRKLIEIKGWDTRLLEHVNELERKTGGWPWALIAICERCNSSEVPDIKNYINNVNPHEILDEWWLELTQEERDFLSLCCVISEGSSP